MSCSYFFLSVGFLNETFDNFTASFFFAGLAIALATILQLFISIFKRRQKHNNNKKSFKDISPMSQDITEKIEGDIPSAKSVFAIQTRDMSWYTDDLQASVRSTTSSSNFLQALQTFYKTINKILFSLVACKLNTNLHLFPFSSLMMQC